MTLKHSIDFKRSLLSYQGNDGAGFICCELLKKLQKIFCKVNAIWTNACVYYYYERAIIKLYK